MRKRDVHIQLWLNEKEAEALSRNAKKCRLSQSAYLRHLIMGYIPRKAPPPDYHAMMQQIYHVGRSPNQIAAKAHGEQLESDRAEIPCVERHRRSTLRQIRPNGRGSPTKDYGGSYCTSENGKGGIA